MQWEISSEYAITFTENFRNMWGNDLVEFSLRFRKYADFFMSWNVYFVFFPPCWMMNARHPTWRPKAKVNFSLKTVRFLYNFAGILLLGPFSTNTILCVWKISVPVTWPARYRWFLWDITRFLPQNSEMCSKISRSV